MNKYTVEVTYKKTFEVEARNESTAHQMAIINAREDLYGYEAEVDHIGYLSRIRQDLRKEGLSVPYGSYEAIYGDSKDTEVKYLVGSVAVESRYLNEDGDIDEDGEYFQIKVDGIWYYANNIDFE